MMYVPVNEYRVLLSTSWLALRHGPISCMHSGLHQRKPQQAPAQLRFFAPSAREFLCTVNCACERPAWSSSRGLLSYTGIGFALPALLFLQQGAWFTGALTTALTVTSVVYHSQHHPLARACDVSVVWALAVATLIFCLHGIATEGATVYLVYPPVGIVTINVINVLPRFRELALDPATGLQKPGTRIALPWHVGLHALCCTSLISLAAAWICASDDGESAATNPGVPGLGFELVAPRWRVDLCTT
jgi:hypothetical protein